MDNSFYKKLLDNTADHDDAETHSNEIFGAYFILTNQCNLGCTYCYAQKSRKMDMLEFETAEPIINLIYANVLMHAFTDRQKIAPYIKFTGGGEPTMNFQVMKEITELSKSISNNHHIKTEFHLATNGQWNDIMISEWIDNNMTNVLFSVDGTNYINNIHRPRLDGKDSYQNILSNYKSIQNPEIKVTFRMTVSNHSLKFLEKDIESFLNVGVKNIQIEPLMPFNINQLIKQPDAMEFAKKYIYLKHKFCKYINIFSSFDVVKAPADCRCGHQAGAVVSVFPDGLISSCPERTADDKQYIRGSIVNKKVQLNTFMPTWGVKPERCKICQIASICPGICSSKYLLFGDNNQSTMYLCDLYKFINMLDCSQ